MNGTVIPPVYRASLRDLIRGAAAAGFVGLFVNLLHLALPLYTIQVYDRVLSSGSMDTLIALAILVTIALCFQSVLDILRHRIFSVLGARVAARLGQPVLQASVETTLQKGPGAAAYGMRDVSELRNFVAGGAIALPMDLLVAPIFLFVLFLLHPVYGVVGLAGALMLTAAAVATEVLARRPAARAALASGHLHTETASAIRNAEVITAMGMLSAVAARWRTAQARAVEDVERGRGFAKALSAVSKTLRIAFQLAIISAGAILVMNRDASAGTIIAAAVIMARLLLPFEQLIEGWRQWVDALAALARIRDVLGTGATARSYVPIAVASGRLSADRLTFVPSGGDAPLLRNVTFSIESGELLGVIGASGAGKSTLARMIVGLWAPTAGGLYLDGQSAYSHERRSFGEAVGYLPQDPMLFDATVAENISRFRQADMEDIVRAARAAGIHEMIGSLPQGYETRVSDTGGRLSGGQRQRLALARALFGDPKLLVLDEPNSSLDAEGEAALVAAIESAKRGGATVVVIAQRMSILKRADHLLVLKDGAVVQFGDRHAVAETLGLKQASKGKNMRDLTMREGSL